MIGSNRNDEVLWSEIYRPQKVSDIILPESISRFAQGIVTKGELPNMTFAGGAGTGKTTLAFALAKELGYETLLINGSEEGRLFETLRNRIKQFASTVSFSSNRKLIVLDEADYIPAETVQPALRGFIEQSSANCSFILTCNFPNKLIEPLRSRCPIEHFNIPQNEVQTMIKKFYVRVKQILAEQNIEIRDEKALLLFISKNFPDWRKTLNQLQKAATVGYIDSTLVKSGDAELDQLVAMMKAKNFVEVRKWVATNPSIDMTSLSRSLYNKMDRILKNESKPNLVLIIAKYQYQHAFVGDYEINIMAMLVEIMVECEFL